MRDVAVIGIGSTVFGKFPERTVEELGQEAALAAIKDANISPRDIQFAHCATLYGDTVIGQRVLSRVGISGIEVVNVENACAGGATSFRDVWWKVASGLYDIGIALGVESMTTSPIAGKLIPPAKDDIQGQLGFTMPGVAALMMRRHMHQYGSTPEQFAMVSVKNHKHGCLNPYSQFQKNLTIGEILNSRMISDPLTLLQCCANTDGAAAAVLCAADIAYRYTRKPITVAASVLKMGGYSYLWKDITYSDTTASIAREAYEIAGYGPEDMNLIELHDPFTPSEITHYEELGLCPRGEGGRLVEEGATELNGSIPVSVSGGLLSKGHPLSATGVAQIVEIVWQLRGEAGQRQVRDAKIGLAHVMGGQALGIEGGAGSIHILKK